MLARWACGPFPAGDMPVVITQGAILGVAIAVGISLTSSDAPSTNRKQWMIQLALHALAGLVLGVLSSAVCLLLYRASGGLFGRTLGWMLLTVTIGAASGFIARSRVRATRAAFAGLVAGLIGGSTLEAMFVWFRASEIHPDLAATMAGVYGLGLLGGLFCVLNEIVDDVFRFAWLLIETGPRAGRTETLDTRRGSLLLGSARDCHVRLLDDETIEPHHAAVSRDENTYIVSALDGTTFAGPPDEAPSPTKRAPLEDRGEMSIGTQRIRFRDRQEEHVES